MFLIRTDQTDSSLTEHFHIHQFLFLAGPMYARLGHLMADLRVTYWLSVYCNSLLATLNVRKAIRGKGHNDLGISLRPIGDSGTSSADQPKVVGLVSHLYPIVAHPNT